jgi:ABC-type polysaccharide transport system permease subunit
MDTNTDSEKIKKITEQNRNRQKTYYQAHKQEILQKKAIEREQIREINLPPAPEPIIPTEFTLEMIYAVFNEKITNKNTKLKYCNDFKRIFKLCRITSFTGTLDEYIIIKKSIDDSRYSLSTKKGSFQSILVLITVK